MEKSATKEVSEDVQNSTEIKEAIKHPLEDTWSIWLQTCDKNKWGKLVKLTSFDTVEDYWCLYHHMKPPSELEFGQDYAIFKNGITPTWDDDANKNGGRWIINVDRGNSELDKKWVLTVLTLIGATLEQRDAVCGAVVNVRKNKNKIGIWLTDASNEVINLAVGKEIKKYVGIRSKINFHRHQVGINMYFI